MTTMIRNVELVRLVQDAVPPVMIPVFIFITYLGSAGVLAVALTLWYWLDGRRRRQSAFVLAMSFCGYGLTIALKDIFTLPRPPVSLHLISAAGYGFPSGHAIESTIVYGALALVLSIGTRRRRVASAAVMFGLIAFSRVILGVHYPTDVLGGIVAGGAFLVGAIVLTRGDPLRGFWLAAAVATVALFVGGPSPAIVILGASMGGVLAWWWLSPTPERRPLKTALLIAVFGIVVLAIGAAVLDNRGPLALRVFVAALGFGGVVGLPTVVHRLLTLCRNWRSSPSG